MSLIDRVQDIIDETPIMGGGVDILDVAQYACSDGIPGAELHVVSLAQVTQEIGSNEITIPAGSWTFLQLSQFVCQDHGDLVVKLAVQKMPKHFREADWEFVRGAWVESRRRATAHGLLL